MGGVETIPVSLFFPVYRDEATVRIVAEKALKILASLGEDHEIVIVNDPPSSPPPKKSQDVEDASSAASAQARERVELMRRLRHNKEARRRAAVLSTEQAAPKLPKPYLIV